MAFTLHDPIDLVNPLQGTYSVHHFSTGNTLPLIAMPHGMTHWSPQTGNADSGWFFHPNERVFEGLRATHQPSPWMGDYSCFVLMPQTGECMPEAWRRLSAFRPEDTTYRPDGFRTYLLRYQCQLDFAPTEYGGKLMVNLHASDAETTSRRLILDLFPGDYQVRLDKEKNAIVGYTRHHRGGVPENFAFYFALTLDTPITELRISEGPGGHHLAVIELATGGRTFNATIGTSFISVEQALVNQTSKTVPGRDWESLLSRISLTGATEPQQRTFYSCLYRALLFPRKLHEIDAAGNTVHYSPYDGKIHPGVLYTDNGFWDTFRTVYPLLSLVYPDLLGEIIDGWLNAYRESGWLPEWASPGHRGCMIGTHSHAVLADAVVKGISGFDYETALEAVVKGATVPVLQGSPYGRECLEEYDRLGYVPCDATNKATSRTLDYAYDDYCIAQIARTLGKTDLYERFLKQSERWKNVFDAGTGFFRGRHSDGSWQTPFDEYEWGGSFVEGSAWQFRFSVPHDPQGLAERLGGPEKLAALIEQMVDEPPVYRVGSYGHEIHEMTEMAVAGFGQYAQSNQPVHNALFMAAAVGFPDVTNRLVHRVLNELYTPDLFPGDEDNGEMAAWYVLCALGLAPLCPGSGSYLLVKPLFEKTEIALPGGRMIIIVSGDGFSPAWNGNPITGPEIAYPVLMEGGALTFPARP